VCSVVHDVEQLLQCFSLSFFVDLPLSLFSSFTKPNKIFQLFRQFCSLSQNADMQTDTAKKVMAVWLCLSSYTNFVANHPFLDCFLVGKKKNTRFCALKEGLSTEL